MTKVKVVSTIPQGKMGIKLIDSEGVEKTIILSKPGTSREVSKDDLYRAIEESYGMKKMYEKGYFMIKANEEQMQELEDIGVDLEKVVLDDMDIKLLLSEDLEEFEAKIETVCEQSLKRIAHVMAESKNIDLNKASALEKYIGFKVADLIEQQSDAN